MLVSEKDTALTMGSGDLPVLATPALVAFMENTAKKLISLPATQSSVGVSVSLRHLKPSPVGAELRCEACLEREEGRRYTFRIAVFDNAGELIGEAQHERVAVDVERFMRNAVSAS